MSADPKANTSSPTTEKSPWWKSRTLAGISGLIVAGYAVVAVLTTPPWVTQGSAFSGLLVGKIFGSIGAGLFWGAIFWSPFRLIRGQASAPNIASFMAAAMILAGTAQISIFAINNLQAQRNPASIVVPQLQRQCESELKATSEPEPSGDSNIKGFCDCFARAMTESMQKAELLSLLTKGTVPEDMASRSEKAIGQCSQTM